MGASAQERLPALGADPGRVSVSGLSSGGFMAVQYDVAFSASTIGAGIVAGGPYNCAYVNRGGIEACTGGLRAAPRSPLPKTSHGPDRSIQSRASHVTASICSAG